MTNFEFVFSLLAILLGLALAEVLGGLARMLKQRPRVPIGWATGLLATWTILETVLFWRVAWRARDALPDTSPALLVGFVITALYYFAAALVFPDELSGRETLDDYFMAEKAKSIGAVYAAGAIAYESLFLSQIDSLFGAAQPAIDPEAIRGAKGMLNGYLSLRYRETRDQLALTKKLDVNLLDVRSRSFRKLRKELGI